MSHIFIVLRRLSLGVLTFKFKSECVLASSFKFWWPICFIVSFQWCPELFTENKVGDGETGDYLMSYPHHFPQPNILLNCGWLLKSSIQANPESPAAPAAALPGAPLEIWVVGCCIGSPSGPLLPHPSDFWRRDLHCAQNFPSKSKTTPVFMGTWAAKYQSWREQTDLNHGKCRETRTGEGITLPQRMRRFSVLTPLASDQGKGREDPDPESSFHLLKEWKIKIRMTKNLTEGAKTR